MKKLRQSKNWTQQHLADLCGLSLRTIQRVEKDGVASNETVAAYASVFELDVTQLRISVDDFGDAQAIDKVAGVTAFMGSALFFVGVAAGVGLTLLLF